MSMLGIHLSLALGPSVAAPAPASLMAALRSAEVTHSDDGRSGFQLIFELRREPRQLQDYALLADPLVAAGNRVNLGLTVGGVPELLFDGFVTNQQFSPGDRTLTLTGEDASFKMDQDERSAEFPGLSDEAIVREILSQYAEVGVTPRVSTPEVSEQPTEDERTPVHQGTDYEQLVELAQRYGYAFYLLPGPAPGQSTGVWGPPIRTGVPQAALSVDLGPATNVDSVDFSYDGLAAELYAGRVQDRRDNSVVEVESTSVSRPVLGSGDPLATARTRIYRDSAADSAMAFARAQALTDASVEDAVEASGELDTGRYGGLLQARALVDLRGVGALFDGTWYVRSVTHKIEAGSYKQAFELARGATGATQNSVEV